jgi:hypothetical protein
MNLLSAEKIIKELGSLERAKQLGDYWALIYMQAEDELNKSEAELAKPCEPVGYVSENALKSLHHPGTNYDLIYRENTGALFPLYTSPPEREPLSNGKILNTLDVEGIERLPGVSCKHEVTIARAIERAHGITVENEKQERV